MDRSDLNSTWYNSFHCQHHRLYVTHRTCSFRGKPASCSIWWCTTHLVLQFRLPIAGSVSDSRLIWAILFRMAHHHVRCFHLTVIFVNKYSAIWNGGLTGFQPWLVNACVSRNSVQYHSSVIVHLIAPQTRTRTQTQSLMCCCIALLLGLAWFLFFHTFDYYFIGPIWLLANRLNAVIYCEDVKTSSAESKLSGFFLSVTFLNLLRQSTQQRKCLS